MPPYWALGFQLCRYGYNTIENMKAAVDRTAQYGIPHVSRNFDIFDTDMILQSGNFEIFLQDVQYGDIDIMERALTFTYSTENFPGLPDYIREMKSKGIKFMTILVSLSHFMENSTDN